MDKIASLFTSKNIGAEEVEIIEQEILQSVFKSIEKNTRITKEEDINQITQHRFMEDVDLLNTLSKRVSLLKEENRETDTNIEEMEDNISSIKKLNEEIMLKINDTIDQIELLQQKIQ